ncbi:MAG: diguanylate cyclase [Chloroflexi bacterium]|nr:diguanylate cyclase [Chloroflexota bacterium]
MQSGLNFYVSLIYLLAAVPYAWLGLFAWRKNRIGAVLPFAWAMLGLSIWTFAYSLELFLPTLPLKLFFARLGYSASVTLPVLFLLFALEYTDQGGLLSWRARLLIWGAPLVTLTLVWSADWHRLVWSQGFVVRMGGLEILSLQRGSFFWIQTVYSQILAAFSIVLLGVEMLQRPHPYRVQIGFIALGIAALAAGSQLYLSRFNPIAGLNLTPLLFLPVLAAISWAISRRHMLDIIPLQHLTVLKNMKDGVIVVNADGRILYFNPLIESLFGSLEKDLIGKPLERISERYGSALAARLAGGESSAEMTISGRGGDGVFEVSVSNIKSREGASQSGSVLILHDITERKKAEAALIRREGMMSALNLAAERFLKESAWEHHIPGILEKIGQAVSVSRVYVFMNYLDLEGELRSSQCYEWAATGVLPQINNPRLQHVNLRRAGYNRWVDSLAKGQAIFGLVADFPESERMLLQEQNVISLAVAPVFVERQWWGFIGFDDCVSERRWEEAELEALRITASLFGSAEARARTEQRLLRRQHTLTLLQGIVSEALSADSLRHMAEAIVVHLAGLVSASDCFITVWDEAAQQVFPLAATDGKNTYLSIQPVSEGRTLTETALIQRHALIIEDAQNSPLFDPQIASQCPSHSLLVLPLTAGEERLGAILFAYNAYYHFQPEETSICEQAAELISLAFEKFKAVEQAQRRAAASETLRKAGAAVAETLETDETVSRILEQLKQVVPYDTASVQVLTENNELEIIGGSGFEDLNVVVGMRFPVPGNNPNTTVIQSGKPYLLRDVGETFEEFKKPPHNHIRSWLGVPLNFQEKIIGLLAIDSSETDHFTQENINLAVEFADQVAAALEKARAYEKAQTQAITDPLTGVYNRRGLEQAGEFEISRARRLKRPLCALMLDIDHFKRVNDRYGHLTGDHALRGLAERCRATLRAVDILGRYGGEEFLILLPETSLSSAQMIAERLRASFIDTPLPTDSGPLRVTISVGVAEFSKFDTFESLVQRSDSALYQAKRDGRNCVRIASRGVSLQTQT